MHSSLSPGPEIPLNSVTRGLRRHTTAGHYPPPQQHQQQHHHPHHHQHQLPHQHPSPWFSHPMSSPTSSGEYPPPSKRRRMSSANSFNGDQSGVTVPGSNGNGQLTASNAGNTHPGGQVQQASIPKRGARACTACRKGKNRCEGEAPCRRCQLSGTQCIFEKPEKKNTQVVNGSIERVSRLEGQYLVMQSQMIGLQASLDRILAAVQTQAPAYPPTPSSATAFGPPSATGSRFPAQAGGRQISPDNGYYPSTPGGSNQAAPATNPNQSGLSTGNEAPTNKRRFPPLPGMSLGEYHHHHHYHYPPLPLPTTTTSTHQFSPSSLLSPSSLSWETVLPFRQSLLNLLAGFRPPPHPFARYGIVPSTAPSSDDESEDTLPRATLNAPIEALQDLANAAAEAAAAPMDAPP
ncbi:hypothetical protein FRC19_003520, partial [Serendipita sp. 401]